MAKFVMSKSRDFTIISNKFLRNSEMSLKAKGLLAFLLSLPDEWECSISGFRNYASDGKGSIQTALNELEALGYLTREPNRGANGRYDGAIYNVFEEPSLRQESPADDVKTDGGKSVGGKRVPGTLINTK